MLIYTQLTICVTIEWGLVFKYNTHETLSLWEREKKETITWDPILSKYACALSLHCYQKEYGIVKLVSHGIWKLFQDYARKGQEIFYRGCVLLLGLQSHLFASRSCGQAIQVDSLEKIYFSNCPTLLVSRSLGKLAWEPELGCEVGAGSFFINQFVLNFKEI